VSRCHSLITYHRLTAYVNLTYWRSWRIIRTGLGLMWSVSDRPGSCHMICLVVRCRPLYTEGLLVSLISVAERRICWWFLNSEYTLQRQPVSPVWVSKAIESTSDIVRSTWRWRCRMRKWRNNPSRLVQVALRCLKRTQTKFTRASWSIMIRHIWLYATCRR